MTDKKTQNRHKMPNVAQIVDEFREYFPDLQVTWAKEGEHEIGRRDTEAGITLENVVIGTNGAKRK